MKLYTRTGDEGETGLFGGGRVRKDHPRVAAYGDVDELNSALGVVRATPPESFSDELLEGIQRDLFSIGGRLATVNTGRVAKTLDKVELPESRIAQLETAIDTATDGLPELRAFVLPAGAPKAAMLHLARTICRRAERSLVTLREDDDVPAVFLVYLNRLSDLLFALARRTNHDADTGDVTW